MINFLYGNFMRPSWYWGYFYYKPRVYPCQKVQEVDKDSMSELFSKNDRLKGINVIRRQNLKDLSAWVQDQDSSDIDIELFTEDILEIQCNNFSDKIESGDKRDSYKYQENSFVWDEYMF